MTTDEYQRIQTRLRDCSIDLRIEYVAMRDACERSLRHLETLIDDLERERLCAPR